MPITNEGDHKPGCTHYDGLWYCVTWCPFSPYYDVTTEPEPVGSTDDAES